jgi:formamidopyrimidine-DNA glycosylase
VAFRVQVAEFHIARSLARRRRVLANSDRTFWVVIFDEEEAVARLASNPDLERGVAPLTQSILGGLGNVFKPEVCFVAGLNPFPRVGELTDCGKRHQRRDAPNHR